MPRKNVVPLLLFALASVFLTFLLGFTVSHFEWFPHDFLSRALDQAEELVVDTQRNHHLVPARYEGAGVVADDRESDAPGVTLLTSFWDDLGGVAGVRIIDDAGATLATYRTDPTELWSETPYQDCSAGQFLHRTNYVHGTYLFEDGDLLFNIEYLGLVRMRASGEVVWRLDRRAHHSIHRAEDGNFWVGATRCVDDVQEAIRRFPGLLTPFTEDLVLLVSPDGEVLKEISLLEALYESRYRPRVSQAASPGAASGDVLHANDAEPLTRAMADEYPMFEAGDLLVSLRNIHMVMVLDPETSEIKWVEDSSLTRQHDPDFIGDGWIAVFDNNSDDWNGQLRGGSRIVAFRPHSGEFRQIYPTAAASRPFFTDVGGKMQFLSNGNLLVTEAQGGRVFEVDGTGRTVWEWLKAREADGETVAEVLEGTRYPFSPGQVRAWQAR